MCPVAAGCVEQESVKRQKTASLHRHSDSLILEAIKDLMFIEPSTSIIRLWNKRQQMRSGYDICASIIDARILKVENDRYAIARPLQDIAVKSQIVVVQLVTSHDYVC